MGRKTMYVTKITTGSEQHQFVAHTVRGAKKEAARILGHKIHWNPAVYFKKDFDLYGDSSNWLRSGRVVDKSGRLWDGYDERDGNVTIRPIRLLES